LAAQIYEAAIHLYQQIGDRLGEANCIKGLGDIHVRLSEYDQARRQYEAAIPIYQQAGAKNSEGICHAGMVVCYRKLGMVNEYHRHVALARELMTKESIYNSACLASVCGDVDEALALLRSALENREVGIAWARIDPDFEWVRDDPRFAQLLDEMAAQQG
jgi:tetratricopeptide (TPR) repeat protein